VRKDNDSEVILLSAKEFPLVYQAVRAFRMAIWLDVDRWDKGPAKNRLADAERVAEKRLQIVELDRVLDRLVTIVAKRKP
jgi:hypothetical protein